MSVQGDKAVDQLRTSASSFVPERECCAVPDEPAPIGSPQVALVGSPNSGKSTLFNGLTGLRSKTGNWPGTSVDVARGTWRTRGKTFDLVDLPGAYSLDPLSPDEALTRRLLLEPDAEGRPDVVVVLVDAAHLARSLYLAAQVRELPIRCVVALSMVDVAAARGIAIDTEELATELGCPVIAVDPRRRKNLEALTEAVTRSLGGAVPAPRSGPVADADDLAREDERFAFIDSAVTAATRDTGNRRVDWSDRIDRVATHRVGGPLLFLGVMWAVFQATTTLAAPLQDWLDQLFSGPITDAATAAFEAAGLTGSWIEGLVVDGLIAGVGMIMTFVPLMAIMFVLLALLEDSGYMARAAVITDRLMRAVGLPGKAFLPIVVGFGCNVPAISATRILSDSRQRILTVLLVPFTSCTARLTVFMLLCTTFFGSNAGTVVFLLYLTSILFVIVVGLALRHTLWRTMPDEPLVLDLPPYQRPSLAITATVTWARLKGFLKTASGIIVGAVCVVWLLQSLPAGGVGSFGDVPVEDSLYASLAQFVAPIFTPAGFGAWEIVSALVVGFVAKEAVLSSWAQTFALADDDMGGLCDHLMQSFATASGGHPLPAVAAFLVFVLAYTPCVATLAAQHREVGFKWTMFGILVNLLSAWVAAVVVFNIGVLL